VNGNLAVWLGSKGVALREVYATNPNLYTADVNIPSGTRVRNFVAEGNNWRYVNFGTSELSGVIVSVNTPFKSVAGNNNVNLWYVVQGQSSTHGVAVTTSIIEVASGLSDYIKISPTSTNLIVGRITPTSSIKGQMSVLWQVPPSKDDTNGDRPSVTWRDYAAGVISGTVPAF
jgi:hypothetical protein